MTEDERKFICRGLNTLRSVLILDYNTYTRPQDRKLRRACGLEIKQVQKLIKQYNKDNGGKNETNWTLATASSRKRK